MLLQAVVITHPQQEQKKWGRQSTLLVQEQAREGIVRDWKPKLRWWPQALAQLQRQGYLPAEKMVLHGRWLADHRAAPEREAPLKPPPQYLLLTGGKLSLMGNTAPSG